MEPLATPAALRLAFEMDEGEQREAERALEELSDDARYYGSAKWVDAASTPRTVITLVLKAAARHMKNYDGLSDSRAGDETVKFADRESMGDATFTADERKRLGELGGNYRPTLHTVGLYAYQRGPARRGLAAEQYVPVNNGSPFPYFADPVDPW